MYQILFMANAQSPYAGIEQNQQLVEQKDYNRQLLDAIMTNNVPGVEGALNKGADIIATNALFEAVKFGNHSVVEVLLKEPNVNVNQTGPGGVTPLMVAAGSGLLNIAQLLLTRNETDLQAVNAEGNDALAFATLSNSKDIVELLIKDKRIQKSQIKNAKRLAKENGNNEMVQLIKRTKKSIWGILKDKWRAR